MMNCVGEGGVEVSGDIVTKCEKMTRHRGTFNTNEGRSFKDAGRLRETVQISPEK